MNTETINTRFGTFEVIHSEEPGVIGEYMVELKFNGTYLGHTIIVGDQRDISSRKKQIFNNNQERSEVGKVRIMNDTMIMDLDVLNIHCDS